MKCKNIIEPLSIIVIFIIMFIIIINVPIIARYKNSGDLIINEIVSANKNVIESTDGNYYDFIEL